MVTTNYRLTELCSCPYVIIPEGVIPVVAIGGRISQYCEGYCCQGRNPLGWEAGFHISSPFMCNRVNVTHMVAKASMPLAFAEITCMTADYVSVGVLPQVLCRV